MTATPPSLSPRLEARLGISVPIIQSGMGGVAGPELAAAVSNAGGLGVLAALRLQPDQVRAGIARMRELTDRPFGVNIWLHDDVRRPPDPDAISDDVVRGAQSVFNKFRPRFGLDARLDRPGPAADLVDAALDVMIEERVPSFSAAIGVPEPELVARFHDAGGTVVAMVATVEDALAAVANGCDAVVAQGSESGGHRSYGQKHDRAGATGQSTLALVPQVVDAVGDRVPVLAAGGIVDGRGMAAMLALGADGVLLGSRFVATRESQASEMWKRRLTEGDRSTALTDGFTGQWARVLRSEFTEAWEEAGNEALPGLLQAAAGADVIGAAKKNDDDQVQPLYAGAAVASMTGIPGAGEVVTQIAADAARILNR
ncbi:MAG: nitronate monooxygenase [Actinomycetota bacterium]